MFCKWFELWRQLWSDPDTTPSQATTEVTLPQRERDTSQPDVLAPVRCYENPRDVYLA